MTKPPADALRILLLRHAHAAWPLPGTRDFDRPLDLRGHDEIERLAAAMSVNGLAPEHVVCSTARRCVETIDLLLARLGISPDVEHTGKLYADNHQAYLDIIASARAHHSGSFMIVGHNPMIEETALALLQHDPLAAEEALGSGFPTAGLFIADILPGADPTTAGQTGFAGLLSPVDA